MAKDVIDLISSSPPPQRPSALPTAQLVADRVTRPDCGDVVTQQTNGGATVRFTGPTDEFHTAGDIDNSISWLPGTLANTTCRAGPGPDRRGSRMQQCLPDGVEFLSDDFDTTAELSDPILVESSGNKRRRVSPSSTSVNPDVRSRSDVRASFGSRKPPLERQSPASTRMGSQNWTRSAASAGGIPKPTSPCSSNPFASSPLSLRRRSPPSPRLNCNDSPDPFASSPKAEEKTRTEASRKRETDPKPSVSTDWESPHPFASSPHPRAKETNHTSRRCKSPDIEIISSPAAPTFTSMSRRQEWDPISSSAPEACADISRPLEKGSCHTKAIDIESDSVDGSTDELPDIGSLAKKPLRPRSSLSRSRGDATSTTRAKTLKTSRNHGSESRQVAKEAEKERKQLEKQAAKEAKTREKERASALAEVNKIRTDKKVSSREMIVDLPLDLSCRLQVENLLEELNVEHTTCGSSNVVKWRRKVTSKFNEDMGHWEPIPLRVMLERHVVVVLTADDFVKLALRNDGVALHYAQMEEEFPAHQVIYLLEGLTPWMRKNRNNRNRQFTSGVRSRETSSSSATRRRNGPAPEHISEDIIEDALLELQIHDALIHHTTIPLETAQWLTVLTQHISTIPYKKQKDQAMSAGFCMESGQVKTGDDTKDTYLRMLQEIARVTAPIAYGIAGEFSSVSALVRGVEHGGPSRLEGIRKTVNREGALSDRTVGQAVSRRMHKVFTGRDELSTDV